MHNYKWQSKSFFFLLFCGKEQIVWGTTDKQTFLQHKYGKEFFL